jgi:ABC-2 type transport system permease protein
VIRLVRAEFLKFRTTQVWFWLLLAAIAVTALLVIVQILQLDPTPRPADVYAVFTSAGPAYIVVFILGVLGVTTEYRYQTITPAVLQTPSRWTLVSAKMIAYILVGAAYALVCVVVQLAITLPWLAVKGVSVSAGHDHIPEALLGVFAVLALFGIVGLGFGALVRNQIVAVSVGAVYLLVLQNLVAAIPKVKDAFPYTPGGAVAAVFSAVGSTDVNGVMLVRPVVGILLLVLWAFVPAIIGAQFTMARDIT